MAQATRLPYDSCTTGCHPRSRLARVALSLVTHLSPMQLASLLMGVLFLANFSGNRVAGQASALMNGFPSMRVFLAMFLVTSLAAGVVLLAISPSMRRLMHGRG